MSGSAISSQLAALPLLEGATTDQLEALAHHLEPGQAEAGQVLGGEGDMGDVFWLVLDGTLDISVSTSHGPRHLATAGAGAIVGELALLRAGPRTATVSAATECRYLAGDHHALLHLLENSSVRARVGRLASSRLAADLKPVRTELPDGTAVLLRPLLPADRHALDTAIHSLSRDSIRRRFFSAGTPTDALVDYLIDIDYVDHFAWTVLEAATHEGMAVARYVRPDTASAAEMAFTTVDRYQGRGIGTLLLGVLGVTAVEAGVTELTALVLQDNMAMRAVFAKAGGNSRFDEPGLLKVTIEPARAAALLDQRLAGAIATAVHDVVTAASLALT
jgi:CRP-like cAMP-binding protein